MGPEYGASAGSIVCYSAAMKYIDLSHVFDDAMPVYPGDPPAELTQIAEVGRDGANAWLLSTGMHVGTHIDAPLHMLADGSCVSDIAPEQCFGRGRLVDARGRESITADLLNQVTLAPGDIVILLTGWYKRFRADDYYEGFPVIDAGFAQALVAANVSMLGLDTPSPDHPPFPIHKLLLGHNVLLLENLTNVENLLDIGDFDITALPVPLRCEGAPVRVVAQYT